MEYDFEIWQDGLMVAGGSAASFDDAEREARHYAMMYSQDGEVEIKLKSKGD